MPSSAPHIDFCLPGRTLNPHSQTKFLLSCSAAYSRQWNPRNLEFPWYEPWGLIFADLVATSPRLAVHPQYYLWYDDNKQPDQAGDSEPPDLGDLTFASIASSTCAVDHALVPDFAITRKLPRTRQRHMYNMWGLGHRVGYVGIPLLCEIKRSGKRCHSIAEALSDAATMMDVAQDQVVYQAANLFRMYPHQQSVILIAVTGFWWTYQIAERETVGVAGVMTDEEDDDPLPGEDEDDEEAVEQDSIHHYREDQIDSDSSSSSDPMDLFKFDEGDLVGGYGNAVKLLIPPRHPILPIEDMELLKTWSSFLLLATPASNQILYLIHQRLQQIVDEMDFTRG
ncbi:hypothetical protein DFH29DRAFT_920994 [Suillus ampliporus]|nr:hypothetical protein DFH29DRAFT_920994 [Suillus ampliporus]